MLHLAARCLIVLSCYRHVFSGELCEFYLPQVVSISVLVPIEIIPLAACLGISCSHSYVTQPTQSSASRYAVELGLSAFPSDFIIGYPNSPRCPEDAPLPFVV